MIWIFSFLGLALLCTICGAISAIWERSVVICYTPFLVLGTLIRGCPIFMHQKTSYGKNAFTGFEEVVRFSFRRRTVRGR